MTPPRFPTEPPSVFRRRALNRGRRVGSSRPGPLGTPLCLVLWACALIIVFSLRQIVEWML